MQFLVEALLLAFVVPLLVMLYTVMAGVAAVIWAPFGALICAIIAWRRRLSPWRCALAGAVCSALFFLPWVYLAARMLGWTISKPLVVLAYFVLYASWWLGPMRYSYTVWSEGPVQYLALWICAWVLIMLTMAVSILMMTTPRFDKVNPFRRASQDDAPMPGALPGLVYLLPFALLWAWIAVLIALTFLSANADS